MSCIASLTLRPNSLKRTFSVLRPYPACHGLCLNQAYLIESFVVLAHPPFDGGLAVLIRNRDTSTVEIRREFAVVGPIFPFMRKLRSGRTSSTQAGKSTKGPESLLGSFFSAGVKIRCEPVKVPKQEVLGNRAPKTIALAPVEHQCLPVSTRAANLHRKFRGRAAQRFERL